MPHPNKWFQKEIQKLQANTPIDEKYIAQIRTAAIIYVNMMMAKTTNVTDNSIAALSNSFKMLNHPISRSNFLAEKNAASSAIPHNAKKFGKELIALSKKNQPREEYVAMATSLAYGFANHRREKYAPAPNHNIAQNRI